MRIAIVTDAWAPQVNGVVRTLQATRCELEAMGHDVLIVSPDLFRSVPCPSYPEIRLALTSARGVGVMLTRFGAEAIHLSTEGPLGLAARRWCLRAGRWFTTAYHTQFPDYVAARTGISANLVWRYIRWFHAPARAILAATPSVEAVLRAHGLSQVTRWGRGVDLSLFTATGPTDPAMSVLPRPIQLYVGRVAIEKNIDAFLRAPGSGSRVVVGDGPARAALAARHPAAVFLGPRTGEALAAAYRTADVLVFPSRTDTFGLVMAEALACGTPVAAFPVTGPLDVITDAVGAMDAELATAIDAALSRDRAVCAEFGRRFCWQASTRQFLAGLAVQSVGQRAAA